MKHIIREEFTRLSFTPTSSDMSEVKIDAFVEWDDGTTDSEIITIPDVSTNVNPEILERLTQSHYHSWVTDKLFGE